VLLVAGLLARVLIVCTTYGTNDAFTWAQFGHYVNQWGLYVQYEVNPYLNHPPLPVYWAVVAHRSAVPSARWYDEDPPASRYFAAVFRIPAVLADAGVCWLLWRMGRRGGGTSGLPPPADRSSDSRLGPWLAAAYAWSPCAMLISAYHTNTDSIMALAILASALALHRGRTGLAGLALAAAINVKLTPLLLVPVLLLCCRGWRDLLRAVAGLAVGVIPFIPLLIVSWGKFYSQAVSYRSNPDSWGILYLLMEATGGPPYGAGDLVVGSSKVVQAYYNSGRWVVAAAVLTWAVLARVTPLRRHVSAFDVFGVALALFMVLAPGFGVQYLITVLPVMIASRPRWAVAYGLISGVYAAVIYYSHWTGDWPAYSYFVGRLRPPVPLIGLLAWGTLIGYVVAVCRGRGARRPGRADSPDKPEPSQAGFRTFASP
jgi:hypothetical protein